MKLKKLASLVLALVMALALAVPAMAAGGSPTPNTTPDGKMPTDVAGDTAQGSAPATKGEIVIKDSLKNQTYSIYKIFDLESYNSTSGAYTYTIAKNSPWYNFVKDAKPEGSTDTYFVCTTYPGDTTKEIVKWNDATKVPNTAENAQAFAKAALAYAKGTGAAPVIAATDSKKATADNETLTFDNLDLGYYLVDSTTGALCSLTSTDNKVEVHEKNSLPTVVKKVKDGEKDVPNESGEGTHKEPNWQESNTAKIGDTVEFQITVNAKQGAEKYVLHDTMSAGLTFGEVTSVKVGDTVVAATNYTVTSSGLTDGCSFEVAFTKDYLDTLTGDTAIEVYYTATLNENAVIGNPTGTDGKVNENDVYLGFGDNNKTETDNTKTYTYKFDLVKTNGDNAVLTGAEFELYPASAVTVTKDNDGKDVVTVNNGEKAIPVVKGTDGNYKVNSSATGESVNYKIEAGKPTITGLSNGDYYLVETKAPDGYNKMLNPLKITINGNNIDATLNDAGDTWTAGGVQVVNLTGAELPSTGGIGTTIFYIVGGVLAAGAVILLITKRRMNVDK